VDIACTPKNQGCNKHEGSSNIVVLHLLTLFDPTQSIIIQLLSSSKR